MPVLLGMILGAILTIAAAYEYDYTTGRAANGLTEEAAGGQPPMVNWDVVSSDWKNFQGGVRRSADGVEHMIKGHTG